MYIIGAIIKTRMDKTGLDLKTLIKKDFNIQSNNPEKNKLILWKDYTKEYLLNNSIYDIKISYNNWFQYKEYREYIARILNLNFTDKGYNEIPSCKTGFGKSSFDGMKYQNKTNKMPVLERYKYFKPEVFKMILDKEAIELNNQFKELKW
jgi:hypothetical protein